MIVWPGRSVPSASASSIIALAMRSFTEPAGFWRLELGEDPRPFGLGLSWLMSTTGVLPMRSRTEESYTGMTPLSIAAIPAKCRPS